MVVDQGIVSKTLGTKIAGAVTQVIAEAAMPGAPRISVERILDQPVEA
jgi:hypothetical protein